MSGALPLSSQQDFYNLFVQILQDEAPQLTDTLAGSDIDILAGVCSLFGVEIQRQTVLFFNKTFIDLANGPDITGGDDDLQTLAVDHFGSQFERPGASAAVDTETFSRANNDAGACTILIGSVVKTQPDASGNVQRYTTDEEVTLTDSGVVTFTISSASVTSGAVYSDAHGNEYTATATISSGTSLVTSGTTNPPATGTLTKVSGTGASSLTYSSVSAPDCNVSVNITAVVAGAAGDAVQGAISVIETSLTDSSIDCTNSGNQTGEDAQDDATYRETIRNLIQALRAATKSAIEGAALSVSGVAIASALEVEQPVVLWNPGTNAPLNSAVGGIYEYFYIPYVNLYIADSAGEASDGLVANVIAAINPYRAFGVFINVVAANAVDINWSASITLNPSGPNFATFSNDTSQITASMASYIANLGVGVSFSRYSADYNILAIWGPAGTNDLTGNTLFFVSSANATAGAVYKDSTGNLYTVLDTIVGATILQTSGGMIPSANVGSLFKQSGGGDTQIIFSAAQSTAFSTVTPTGDVSIGSNQSAIPGTVDTV